MDHKEAFIYSPFSKHTVWNENRRSLLLQFILSEILIAKKQQNPWFPPSHFFPFDWAHEVGALNKVEEHMQLLICAFPSMEVEIGSFAEALQTAHIPLLVLRLQPFLSLCEKSKTLQHFLQKNHSQIEELSCE